MKERKLSFPELESQLKRTRMFATQAAASAVDGTKCSYDDDKFKDSCVEDAKTYTILDDPKEYLSRGIVPNNGTTLVRATFPETTISEHYHSHSESLEIEQGLAFFSIKRCDVVLDDGSSIKIPANSFHTCEFRTETIAVLGLPTPYVKKHLSSPAS